MEEKQSETLETGKFHFDNGAQYEGEWKYVQAPDHPDKESETELNIRIRHGKGNYKKHRTPNHVPSAGKYTEGEYYYEGDWIGDKMHGTGEFHFASGGVYRGGFYENVYHGFGTYKTPSGAVYEGSWTAGKMHGHGMYTDEQGRQFEGQFYNGSGPHLKRIL